MEVRISKHNNELVVQTPYTPEWPARAKALGGRWVPDLKVWMFNAAGEKQVREAVKDIYGTDGTPERTVTVRYLVEAGDSNPLWIGPRKVAWRYSKRSPVNLAEGVAVIQGEFPGQAGSTKYPALLNHNDKPVLIQVGGVPETLAREQGLEIVEEESLAAKIEQKRKEIAETEQFLAQLRAELAELEGQLE